MIRTSNRNNNRNRNRNKNSSNQRNRNSKRGFEGGLEDEGLGGFQDLKVWELIVV